MCKFLLEFFKKIDAPLEHIIESGATENEEETEIIETNESENNEEKENDMELVSPVAAPEKKYNGTVILLDNGHAQTTPGKRSPVCEDGYQFFEYEFNRDIVRRISEMLDELGVKHYILVPEIVEDIPLSKRAERANKYCTEFGAASCLFISVHANAAGNGLEWKNARGWSVWTTKGNTKSDEYATIFFEEAEKILPKCGMTLRKDMTDGDPDYEENFTVIYKTKCPALLTENLFMDNKEDMNFLRSAEGRKAIAKIHVNAIKRICFE